jgi:hypothetical protein
LQYLRDYPDMKPDIVKNDVMKALKQGLAAALLKVGLSIIKLSLTSI